jgi:ribosomal protein S8
MDIVSKFFNEINMGYILRRKVIFIPNSETVLCIIRLFYEHGLISGYSFDNLNGILFIIVFLKYIKGQPLFKRIERISKSKRRVYVKKTMFLKNYLMNGTFLLLNSRKGIILSNTKNMVNVLNFLNGEILAKIIY